MSQDSSQPQAKVVVLTTGGTISCTQGPDGALVPTIEGDALLAGIRERFSDTTTIEVRDLFRLDSSSMTFSDIDEIVAAVQETLADPTITGIVVTHGTDSMEESAVAVDTFLDDPRPVVFTGAQKPFDAPDPDGPGNLFEAIVIAADASARGIGALIVFGHAVIPARGAVKWHTSDELAFATNGPEEPTRPDPVRPVRLAETRVDIISGYPGADATQVRAALSEGAQGLVVTGLGAGNVGTELGKALGDTLDAGVPVVISTRVPRGEVVGNYGGAGGGATLLSKGALGSSYFRSGQARVLLAIAIATGRHPATLIG